MMKKGKSLVLGLMTIGCLAQTVPAFATNVDKGKDNTYKVEKNFSNEIDTYGRKVIKVTNENMSYIQLGDIKSAKSIVIMHGSAMNANVMIPYGECYAKAGYNVVLVDLPGHYNGVGTSKDEFQELGDRVSKLMDKLIKQDVLNEKSEVQGWSLGGSVALDLAIRHPKHISAVGIIDSASNFNGLDLGSVTDENRLASLAGAISMLKSTTVSQDITDRIIAELPVISAPTEAINNDYAIDKVLNIDNSISKIKVPVYDFFGSADALTTLAKQNEMLAKIKDVTLYVGKDYNHFAVVENPDYVFNAFEEMRNAK